MGKSKKRVKGSAELLMLSEIVVATYGNELCDKYAHVCTHIYVCMYIYVSAHKCRYNNSHSLINTNLIKYKH